MVQCWGSVFRRWANIEPALRQLLLLAKFYREINFSFILITVVARNNVNIIQLTFDISRRIPSESTLINWGFFPRPVFSFIYENLAHN